MTTSQTSFLSEILSGQPIPIRQLAYFRARLSNKIHALVISEFMRLERENKINRAELARRIGRKPEQVTRWLGAPGNWTLETFSDLLLGMGYEPRMSISPLEETPTMHNQAVINAHAGSIGIESFAPAAAATRETLPSHEYKANALAAAGGTLTYQSERDRSLTRKILGECFPQGGEQRAARYATEARI